MSIPRHRDELKSDEEFAVVLWLQEATRHGLVDRWEYEPKSFCMIPKKIYTEAKQMKTKVKLVDKTLHQEATYTPDFAITLSTAGYGALMDMFKPALLSAQDTKMFYIDVKGTYNPHQNDSRYFSLVQKLMFNEFDIWVQKVIPYVSKKQTGLFSKTWAPEKLRWMKNGKSLNALGRSCCNVSEFMKTKDVAE